MDNQRTTHLEALLDKLCTFIEPYKCLLNSHNVQYLIDDHWNNVLLNNELKNDIEILIDQDLTILEYYDSMIKSKNSLNLSFLDDFLSELSNLHEEWNFTATSKTEDIIKNCPNYQNVNDIHQKNEKLKHSDRFMTEKKSHEVDKLSYLIAQLCADLNLNKIIDIGAGKGYLSTQLSYLYNFKVFAIDSNAICLNGSQKRLEKMKKQTNLGIDESQKINNLNEIVNEETNLADLLHLNDSNFCLCGLHSCGNLSNHIINLYMHNKRTSSSQNTLLCFVSCCYHLINEKYLPAEWDYIMYDENVPVESRETLKVKTFPMSSKLNRKKFFLGRNMRMLSAQPIEKLIHNNLVNDRGLWFRSLLQVIFKEKFQLEGIHLKTGKIAAKCEDFNEYVRKAISKLRLDNSKISTAEIDEYWQKFSRERIRFYYYFQFKILFSSIIEYIILLDRLIYLKEESNSETNNFLVKLFDPILSPRCYCLISF